MLFDSKKHYLQKFEGKNLCQSCYNIKKREEGEREFQEATDLLTRVAGISYQGINL